MKKYFGSEWLQIKRWPFFFFAGINCTVSHALSLSEVLQESLQSHPVVLTQQRQIEVSQFDKKVAQQQYLPTPSVSLEQASASAQDPSYRGDKQVQIYRLQQPVWTGGRISAGVDKAQAGIQLADANLSDAKLQISYKVLQTWSEWSSALHKTQAISEALKELDQLDQALKRRIVEGVAAPTEQVLTESRIHQTRAQLELMNAQIRISRARLEQLIGRAMPVDFNPQSLAPYPVESSQQIQINALPNFPAYQKIQAQIKNQEAELQERKADLYPEIYLRVEHQRGNYTYPDLPSINRVFFGLSSRLGAGLTTSYQIDTLRKQRDVLDADHENVQRNLHEQIDSDWIQLNATQSRLPSLKKSLDSAKLTFVAWNRQHLAGRKSWMEVMNTIREMLQAELDLIDAESQVALISWKLTLLSETPELAIMKMKNFEAGAQ
jgi:adhesin transport system outer membrane protein